MNSVTTRSACESSCVSQLLCWGYDWKPSTSQCWSHTSFTINKRQVEAGSIHVELSDCVHPSKYSQLFFVTVKYFQD